MRWTRYHVFAALTLLGVGALWVSHVRLGNVEQTRSSAKVRMAVLDQLTRALETTSVACTMPRMLGMHGSGTVEHTWLVCEDEQWQWAVSHCVVFTCCGAVSSALVRDNAAFGCELHVFGVRHNNLAHDRNASADGTVRGTREPLPQGPTWHSACLAGAPWLRHSKPPTGGPPLRTLGEVTTELGVQYLDYLSLDGGGGDGCDDGDVGSNAWDVLRTAVEEGSLCSVRQLQATLSVPEEAALSMRVEPGKGPGQPGARVATAVLEHYVRLLSLLREQGMEPFSSARLPTGARHRGVVRHRVAWVRTHECPSKFVRGSHNVGFVIVALNVLALLLLVGLYFAMPEKEA